MSPFPDPLSDPLLARAAELRAGGSSWEIAARELNTSPDHLRQVADAAGPLYRRHPGRAEAAATARRTGRRVAATALGGRGGGRV